VVFIYFYNWVWNVKLGKISNVKKGGVLEKAHIKTFWCPNSRMWYHM